MQDGGVGEIDPWTLRLFYSLRDFQFALSAFDFLPKPALDHGLSWVELRRVRCYLEAGVIAYCRPFTATKGVPTLSLKQIGVKPTAGQRELHDSLWDYRNKVVAHSDADRMRIAVLAMQPFEDRQDIAMPVMVVDQGVPFLNQRDALIAWLRVLKRALSEKTFALAQSGPRPFGFRKDYLGVADEG